MYEDIQNIDKSQVVLIGIATSIIIYYFQNLLAKVFVDREKKKGRDIWIRFFSEYNKNIGESISQFKKIESPYDIYTYFIPSMGYALGYIFFFIPLYYMLKWMESVYLLKWMASVYAIAFSIILIFSVILVLTVFVGYYIGTIKPENFFENCKFALHCIKFINWFTFFSSYLSVLFIYITYSILNANERSESDLINISVVFIMAFIFFVIIIISTYIYRRDLLNRSKKLLNLNYFEKFPHIHIKTNSLDFQGKICDAFNENLIILDDNGVKKAVEWHSVSYLELGEEHSDNTNTYERI